MLQRPFLWCLILVKVGVFIKVHIVVVVLVVLPHCSMGKVQGVALGRIEIPSIVCVVIIINLVMILIWVALCMVLLVALTRLTRVVVIGIWVWISLHSLYLN